MRSQLAIEFVASSMIFLFAVILVVSSIFRGYFSVSDSEETAILENKAEKLATEIVESTNGFASPEGGLDRKIFSIQAKNYSALKEVIKTKEDFKVSVSLLPSVVLSVYLENPLSKGPGEASYSFDTFLNSTPINLTVLPRVFDGSEFKGKIYALLIGPSNNLIDLKEVDAVGRASLTPSKEGVYTIQLIAYNKTEMLYGYREISIGVVAK